MIFVRIQRPQTNSWKSSHGSTDWFIPDDNACDISIQVGVKHKEFMDIFLWYDRKIRIRINKIIKRRMIV